MVSVCTVILSRMEEYVSVLSHSLGRNAKHVKEVIFVKVDALAPGSRSWQSNGIEYRMIDYPVTEETDWNTRGFMLMVAGHALGLHHGIDQAREEYVWLTDPDVFFFTAADELYLDLMWYYNLGIVGISHFTPQQQSYLDFPCVTNCMVRKADLPGVWLDFALQSGMRLDERPRRLMPMPGKYLIPGPICPKEFPNPQGTFDVGCHLWQWAKEKDWRWLSFYRNSGDLPNTNDEYGFKDLVYPMNYNTGDYRTNFGLKDDLGHQDILYHRTMAVGQSGESYKRLYDSLFPTQPVDLERNRPLLHVPPEG